MLKRMSHGLRTAALSAALVVGASAAQAAIIGGIDFPDGEKSFADKVVDFQLGALVSGTYDNPQDVLGIPDYDGTNGSFSLGNPSSSTTPSSSDPLGFVTVQFTDNSLTTSGDAAADLFVFEIGGAIESYKVEISKDNVTWIEVATVTGQPSQLDIDGVAGVQDGDKFSFVRVSDVFGGVGSGSPFGGPDIDAIGAISSADAVNVVPLPAGGLLLMAGIASLAGLRRRKG